MVLSHNTRDNNCTPSSSPVCFKLALFEKKKEQKTLTHTRVSHALFARFCAYSPASNARECTVMRTAWWHFNECVCVCVLEPRSVSLCVRVHQHQPYRLYRFHDGDGVHGRARHGLIPLCAIQASAAAALRAHVFIHKMCAVAHSSVHTHKAHMAE